MLRKLLLPVSILFLVSGNAQPLVLIDTLKKQLSIAKSYEEKTELLGELSRAYMNIDRLKGDEYGKKMIETAEISRDRSLMVKALLTNGERVSYFAGIRENISKAIDYYSQALDLAKKNKLEEETAYSLLALSRGYQLIPDADKSLNYINQAFSIITAINNDSLKAVAYNRYGEAYMIKKEKLLSLRNYLFALRIAEEKKNNKLLRVTYKNLAGFYASIDEYDKAIDFAGKSMESLRLLNERSAIYYQAIELNYMGSLYSLKKNYDMSRNYYEQAIELADSLKHQQLKLPAYMSILNQFLITKEPQKALDYFNSNADLRNMINNYGLTYVIEQAYGYIYMDLGRYDSAKYYYSRAAPFYEKGVNQAGQVRYYMEMAELHKRTGENEQSINYLTKAQNIAENMGELEAMRSIARHLDSAYTKRGDYRQSYLYKSKYHWYNDSLQKLSEEKDLMQLEIQDEHQRQERIAKEQAEKKRQRHNIQYIAITIGIALLFIILVMLGMFRVSATTIKIIGFFSFLMLFEFIFLMFKKNIYGITAGEPWKDLAFMILIATLLVPLHHWLEHKVVHYLTSKKMIIPSGKSIWNKFSSKQPS